MNFIYLADRPNALPKLAEWYFGQWGDLAGDDSPEQTRFRLQEYLNRDEIPLMILAADSNGDDDDAEILGAGQLKYYEMDIYPDKKHWLGGIFIHPNHRDKGVASALVIKLTEIARSLGVQTLYLQTEQTDGGLYARLGWEPVERTGYRGANVLVMENHLAG